MKVKISKLFCIALALMMVSALFAGCGKKEDNEKTTTEPTAGATAKATTEATTASTESTTEPETSEKEKETESDDMAAEVLEDFEDGNVTAGPEWMNKNYHWEIADAGGPVEIKTVSSTPDSSGYAGDITFKYDGKNAAAQYAFFPVDTSGWKEKGINAMRFWFKGDADNPEMKAEKFAVELRSLDDEGKMRWAFDLSADLQNSEWKQYTVSFKDMYITKGIDELTPEVYNAIKEFYFGSQYAEKDVHFNIDKIEMVALD